MLVHPGKPPGDNGPVSRGADPPWLAGSPAAAQPKVFSPLHVQGQHHEGACKSGTLSQAACLPERHDRRGPPASKQRPPSTTRRHSSPWRHGSMTWHAVLAGRSAPWQAAERCSAGTRPACAAVARRQNRMRAPRLHQPHQAAPCMRGAPLACELSHPPVRDVQEVVLVLVVCIHVRHQCGCRATQPRKRRALQLSRTGCVGGAGAGRQPPGVLVRLGGGKLQRARATPAACCPLPPPPSLLGAPRVSRAAACGMWHVTPSGRSQPRRRGAAACAPPVGGSTLRTNMKMACSGETRMRLRMTYTNWPTVRSAGTRYLRAGRWQQGEREL